MHTRARVGLGRRLVLLADQGPGVDAGDVLGHVGLDAEAVEGWLEPRVDLIAGQASRRIDVGEASDGNVLEKHGLAAGLRTKGNPYYRVRGRAVSGRGRNGQFPQRQAANCWSPFSGGPSGLMVWAPIPGA